MADRSVLVRLQANIADFRSQMDQAARSVKGVGDQSEKSSQQATTALGRVAQSARDHEKAWTSAGTAMTGFGVVTVAALGATVKAAMDWESAWAGVTKTVSGTDEELAQVESGLRGLARTLPATHGEIAAVAEAAGQLGVKTAGIVDFTRTMIDLGQTTNLSADEAATSLAQLMNVMQTAPEDVGRLGAALVALGNDGASTEADIVRMASYITGSARLIGASESDVLALANAMTSMGINAERGGGVMTRVMQDVYAAVKSGGSQLEGFAEIAGVSSAEFARAFEEDPIRAIDSFIRGLNDVEASGGNVVESLKNLGYVGTQDTAVLLQMKGAGDLLTESLDLGNKAWEDNTALIEEAGKRYDTTAAQLAIARNNITDAAIEIGETFLPVLADMAEGLAGVAGWFADLPDPIQGSVGGLFAVAGMASLAGGAFLILFPRIIETRKAFQLLRADMPGLASGLGKVGKAAGIAGIFMASAAAADSFFASIGPGPATMEETTAALLKMGGGMDQVNQLFHSKTGLRNEIDGLADAAARITKPGVIDRINDFGGSLGNIVTFGSAGSSDGAAERARIIGDLDKVGESLALVATSGDAEMAAEQFDMLAEEWKKGGGDVDELLDLMPAYKAALGDVENQQRMGADAARDQRAETLALARDVDNAYGSLEGYAAALGMDEEATKQLVEASNSLGESLGAFIDPLGTYTGMLQEKAAAEEAAAIKSAEAAGKGADAWRDFVVDTGFSFDEYMRRLEEQVTAQSNWQVNMLRLAGRVSQGTLEELARMGPEGAPLVADLVNRSDAELNRFDEITALRSKEATDAWGAQLTLAGPVLAQVGAVAGQGVVDELAAKLRAGTITVAEIAAQFGINLAGGVNPLLAALGHATVQTGDFRARAGVVVRQAKGGLLDFYAGGGMQEDHVAQIAPAGAWRVWAEEETGGEAYIPLSPAKRSRSVDIWRQVGDRLGVRFEEFAFGGIRDVPHPPSTAPYQTPISTAGDATMKKAYDQTVAWLTANVGTLGVPGNDAVGGGAWREIYDYVKARVPEARVNSSFRPGDPGRHGLGLAVDFGFGSGPGGAGSPGLALINRVLHDGIGGRLRELIYDGLGDDRPDLYLGKPHTYNASTRADHDDHVHAAFAKGGILNPHVRDAGGPLLPGYTFNGTGGPETVLPNHVVDGRASGAPIEVKLSTADLDGLPVTGRFVMDPSGIVHLVDGRIAVHDDRRAVDARRWR